MAMYTGMCTEMCTDHLALVRWGLQRAIEGCELLHCDDTNKNNWTAALADLAGSLTCSLQGSIECSIECSVQSMQLILEMVG